VRKEKANIEKIIKYLRLDLLNYYGQLGEHADMTDLGNILGISIGKQIKNNKDGWALDDFIDGLKHGKSLVDGTHNQENTKSEDFERIEVTGTIKVGIKVKVDKKDVLKVCEKEKCGNNKSCNFNWCSIIIKSAQKIIDLNEYMGNIEVQHGLEDDIELFVVSEQFNSVDKIEQIEQEKS
jgi:hypothetical protein